jgi:hypothetical protein
MPRNALHIFQQDSVRDIAVELVEFELDHEFRLPAFDMTNRQGRQSVLHSSAVQSITWLKGEVGAADVAGGEDAEEGDFLV